MDVLIFVVDSNDRERMEEVKMELGRLVREDELRDCCLLVMANKQDLPNAMSVQELITNLDLCKLPCSWCKPHTHTVTQQTMHYKLIKRSVAAD